MRFLFLRWPQWCFSSACAREHARRWCGRASWHESGDARHGAHLANDVRVGGAHAAEADAVAVAGGDRLRQARQRGGELWRTAGCRSDAGVSAVAAEQAGGATRRGDARFLRSGPSFDASLLQSLAAKSHPLCVVLAVDSSWAEGGEGRKT